MSFNMVRDYKSRRKSRLQKVEDKKDTKQAIFFAILTVVVLILIVVFGVPSLIKLAIFFGDVRSSNTPIEQKDSSIGLQPPTLSLFYEATRSANIDIKGYGLADSKIKLYINGRSMATDTNLKGDFIFRSVNLSEGENKIEATTIMDNEESKPSRTISIIYGNQAPDLIIDTPKEGQKYFDFDKDATILGLTEVNASLYINDRLVIVDRDGSFESKVRLIDGENKIMLKAIDQAGNQTEKELILKYFP